MRQQDAQQQQTLQGKKVILFGGSSGIGLATAKAVSSKGGQTVIVSSNQQRLDKALKELPGDAIAYAVDVTKEEDVRSFFDEIGSFDHLIFTAGENIMLANVSDTSLEMARGYFNIRYWGAFTVVKYAAPFLKKTGSIVLTSGIASNRPNKGWALGASICAAMEGFTRAMAMELAPVRVNAVSPGVVRTALWDSMKDNDREAMYAAVSDQLPVKQVGEASDIAKVYIYLMEQVYCTGQTIIVDGGASLV